MSTYIIRPYTPEHVLDETALYPDYWYGVFKDGKKVYYGSRRQCVRYLEEKYDTTLTALRQSFI